MTAKQQFLHRFLGVWRQRQTEHSQFHKRVCGLHCRETNCGISTENNFLWNRDTFDIPVQSAIYSNQNKIAAKAENREIVLWF